MSIQIRRLLIEWTATGTAGRLANDLQEALRLHGVYLNPDATEAVVKALAPLEGEAS